MKQSNPSRLRRALLKTLAGTGAVAGAGLTLPEHWTRPVIKSAVLPAHAQGSAAPNGNFQVTVAVNVADAGDVGGDLLNLLVPAAHAEELDDVTVCMDVDGNLAAIEVYSCLGNGSGSATVPFDISFSLSNGVIAATAQVTGSYDPVEDAVTGQVTFSDGSCEYATAGYSANRGTGPCVSASKKKKKKCTHTAKCKKTMAKIGPRSKTQKMARAGGRLKASRKRRAKV